LVVFNIYKQNMNSLLPLLLVNDQDQVRKATNQNKRLLL